MSLVSAFEDPQKSAAATETASAASESASITSGKRIHKIPAKYANVYRQDGAPMSKEALYRAKLKYGVYESPANAAAAAETSSSSASKGSTYSLRSNLGVTDARAASDVAALKASENITEIHSYRREKVDAGATSAAKSLTSLTKPKAYRDISPKLSAKDSHAALVGAKASGSTKRSNSNLSAERTNSVLRGRMETGRYVPTRSITSVTSNGSISGNLGSTPAPNMNKILQGAESQAKSRMNNRWDPSKVDYVHKQDSNGDKKISLTNSVMSNIYTKSAKPEPDLKSLEAKKSMSEKFSKSAAYAVKDINPSADREEEMRMKEEQKREYMKHLTSNEVMSLARTRADSQLSAIDGLYPEKKLFDNDAFNRAAAEIARNNYKVKMDTMLKYDGKVNLGGGLYLSHEEVAKVAHGLVSPVLGEISERAEQQRAMDIEIAERNKSYNKNLSDWQAMQNQKTANDSSVMEMTRRRMENEKREAKEFSERQFERMVKSMEEALEKKRKKLERTKQKQLDVAIEMEKKLESQKARVDEELENWKADRKLDLEQAREEQETLLKPYHDDLKATEEQHEALVKERDDINDHIANLKQSIDDHKKKIDRYQVDLEDNERLQQKVKDDLENLHANRNELYHNYADSIVIRANKAKEEAELSSKEARLRQLQVDAMVNTRKSELNTTEIELKREKLRLLESMKEAAQARGDEKLDDAKIKTLLGMSASDYLNKTEIPKEFPITIPFDAVDKLEQSQQKKKKSSFTSSPEKTTIKASTHKSQSKPLGNSKAVNTQPQSGSKPSLIKKVLLGTPANANEQKAPLSKTVNDNGPRVSDKKPTRNLTTDSENLKSTFSGFSQGSILVEDSKQHENNDTSYFKEVI